mmetsp:Transcript_28939/g.51715  ORF Transcript_28939/g.51715 Transcript_28939/m.51715 type:complete len:463 (+) Transcript_28939:426-1814(+)
MWKYRQYVKYMAWHFQWIFITVICYMPALMVHIVNTLGFDSCLLVYATMILAAASGFLPALIRLRNKSLRHRLMNSLGFDRELKRPQNFNENWEEDTTYVADAAGFAMMEFNEMNYSGIFKSLSAKFIVDSVSALSHLFISKAYGKDTPDAAKGPDNRYNISSIKSHLTTETNLDTLLTEENIRLIEYSAETFEQIREKEGFTAFDFIEALDPAKNIRMINAIAGKKGGNSGAFLFCTHDRRLMLKTIHSTEKILLLNEFLPAYTQRILSGSSLLVRIFGIFMLCVGSYSINLLVMQNINYLSEETNLKFDLKGSKYKRTAAISEGMSVSSKVLKDTDFNLMGCRLLLSKQDADKILEVLSNDLSALASFGLMDYSLSLAECSGNSSAASKSIYYVRKVGSDYEYYMMAIIDFMQTFDTRKRIESWFKQYVRRVRVEDLSAVEPKLYAERFLRYIENIVLIK